MSEQTGSTNTDKDSNVSIKVVAKWISLIIAILAVIYFLIYFGHGGLAQGRLAQFGDFVGGTLNPLLGFFTVGLLIWSIQIQMKELKATREELAATKVETELSRRAMEAQVQHLEEQSLQTQLLRLINDKKVTFNELANSILMHSDDTPYELGDYNVGSQVKNITYKDVIQKKYNNQQLDTPDAKFLIGYVQGHYLDKQYNEHWLRIENTACQLGLLTLKYFEVTDDVFVMSVYLREPLDTLYGLKVIRKSPQVLDIIKQLETFTNTHAPTVTSHLV